MQTKPFRVLSALLSDGLLGAGAGTAVSGGTRDTAGVEVVPAFAEVPLPAADSEESDLHKGIHSQDGSPIPAGHRSLTSRKLPTSKPSPRYENGPSGL